MISATMGQHHGAMKRQTKRKTNMARTKVSYQTVAMAFLTGGVPAARTMLTSEGVADPSKMAMKAAVQIETMGGNAGELNALAKELAPERSAGGAGRSRLQDGDVREYKAQQVKQGEAVSDLFIRLPVSLLANNKGDKILVTVEGDRLVVTRA